MDNYQKEYTGIIFQENPSPVSTFSGNKHQDKPPGIAIYLRISRQDEDFGDGKDESNSIENQRKLLLRYIDDHPDLTGTIYEFRDDGVSGASFTSRPAFMEMIEEAKQGIFDTILVKDFSRLGRDYIGVADYVERIFPLLGIRFISVNNHFDSGSASGASMDLGLALENLINTFYLQDTIKKRRSADEVRWKQGKATAAHLPFGYYWDKRSKGKWNLDPVSSKYVRYIFNLALDGKTTRQIADTLNDKGIPTVGAYNVRRMAERTQEEQDLLWPVFGHSVVPVEEQLWTSSMVRTILRRYEYTGALVMGKYKRTKSSETGKKSCVNRPPSEHIVAEGAHEAIVTLEEFEKAQKAIKSVGERQPCIPKEYPLKGKVRCGTCRRALAYRDWSSRNGSTNGTFWCQNKYYAKDLSECHRGRYLEEDLNARVMQAIEQVISVAQVLEIKLESISQSRDGELPDVKRIETQIRVLREERIRQYEGYADGMITRKEYLAKKEKINKKIQGLEEEMEEAEEVFDKERQLLEEIRQISRANVVTEEASAVEKKPMGEERRSHVLTRALVEAFIENVYIYDESHIEIIFKCEDVIKNAIDRISEWSDTKGQLREP